MPTPPEDLKKPQEEIPLDVTPLPELEAEPLPPPRLETAEDLINKYSFDTAPAGENEVVKDDRQREEKEELKAVPSFDSRYSDDLERLRRTKEESPSSNPTPAPKEVVDEDEDRQKKSQPKAGGGPDGLEKPATNNENEVITPQDFSSPIELPASKIKSPFVKVHGEGLEEDKTKKPKETKTPTEDGGGEDMYTPPNVWTGETPKLTQGFETAPLGPDSEGEGLLPEDDGSGPKPKSPKSPKTPPENVPPEIPPPANPESPTPKTPETPTPSPKERVSLLDRIEGANWDSEEAVNLAELGVETGWFKSALNKMSIKMGWSKDIVNYAELSTIDKLAMNYDNFWNDRLINKKRGEISRLDRRIRRESNSKTESIAKENLIKIDKSIEEARKSGNKNLEDILLATREKISTEVSNKRGRLEDEKNSLTSQLERYGERKVAILDNFVASVEIKTENIRNNNDYYENIKKRSTLNNQIEGLSGVISETLSEIISLRKALAFTKDKEDKRIIKDSIKEYKIAIKESEKKRKVYERINQRLGSFIELTDKRTDRFDALRDRYVRRRDVAQGRTKGEQTKKPKTTPPPLPQQQRPPEQTEPTPQPHESETNNEEEGELNEKRDKIKTAMKDFVDIIKTKGDSTPEDGKKVVGKALAVHTPFFEAAKDDSFKDSERKIFNDAEKEIEKFVKKINKNGNVATEADKASMRKYMSGVSKDLKATAVE